MNEKSAAIGAAFRVIGIELKASPNPIRKALGLVLIHDSEVLVKQLQARLEATFGHSRAQEIMDEMTRGMIRGQKAHDAADKTTPPT